MESDSYKKQIGNCVKLKQPTTISKINDSTIMKPEIKGRKLIYKT